MLRLGSRRFVFGCLSVCALVLFAACTPQTVTVEKTVTQVVEVDKVVEKIVEKEVLVTPVPQPKVITVGMGELVTSLDPPTDWAIAATNIHMSIFDCLVWRNRNSAAFEPWLAESYEALDDTTWRFNLRKGVKFHNGEDFKSDAVAWTYNRILADATMITAKQWTFITEVRIVDDYTVDIVTGSAQPAMLSKMSGTGCGIQAPIHGKKQADAKAEYVPVGAGPFMFKEMVKDDHVTLVANPDYWQGKPDIDELVWRSIPETSTRVASLLSGEIDFATGVPSQDWASIDDNPGTSVTEFLTNRTMLIALRTGPSEPMPDFKGVTTNKKIRQAIGYAIDRRVILEVINGMGIPTLSRVTPPTLGWSPKFYNQYGEYNPDKARELLKEAGYNNEVLTFHTGVAWLYQKDVAETIAAMLKDVGMNIDLQVMDTTTFREKIYAPNKNLEIYMDALGNSFFDPWITMKEFEKGQKQRSGWVNSEMETLLVEAGMNMDPESRRSQFVRVQELINEEVPHVYLYTMKDAYGKSDRLDFSMNPDGFLWFGFSKVSN